MTQREDREYYDRLWERSGLGRGCFPVLLTVIAAVILLLTLTGCRSSQPMTEQSERRDSIIIKYIERVVTVHDTAYVVIPAQTAERTTQDSLSHLENDYAVSDARVNPDGSLTHTLETKPQTVAVPYERKDTERETVREESHREAEKEKVTEYVDKPLTWWQRTQIYGLWAVLFLLAVIYRRKIFAAAVRLFLKK